MHLTRITLLLALTILGAAAFPQAPASRQEALSGLQSADAPTRAAAVAWIARNGRAGDDAPLYARLRDESPTVRGFAEQALWLIWSRSGDTAIDQLLERGVDEMQSGRSREAIATFSEVIRRRPAFAEGWNKRATALYLAGEFQRSLADCDEVLKRNPGHFGALSGLGQVYLALQDYDNALAAFRRALEVNPNMVGVELQIRMLEEKTRARPGAGQAT
jgi:tetratricopeptide (TPR) repeat protein